MILDVDSDDVEEFVEDHREELIITKEFQELRREQQELCENFSSRWEGRVRKVFLLQKLKNCVATGRKKSVEKKIPQHCTD